MKHFLLSLLISISCCTAAYTDSTGNLFEVTPAVQNYADAAIVPVLLKHPQATELEKLLLIVDIMMDEKNGISSMRIKPSDFMRLSIFSGKKHIRERNIFLLFFPKQQRETLRLLHNKYMLREPSGIFFGPSASDIIEYKSGFGCSHYARAFMSIVQYLKLVVDPGDLRYVISCDAEDYNKFLTLNENKRKKMTINGHQFVMIKIDERWYAINTNRKNDYVLMEAGFSPGIYLKDKNIPISFSAIPGKTFLLRKIGENFNDDCGDDSLSHLQNIYLSGSRDSHTSAWEKYAQ